MSEDSVVNEEFVEQSVVEEPVTIAVVEGSNQISSTYTAKKVIVMTPSASSKYHANPKLIFIVPYRDRQQQYEFFSVQMKTVLSNIPESSYKILYIHQLDTRDFNRGAMKNIGFLVVKNMYPDDYQNITLVFNDIDTMPMTAGFLNYHTSTGIVKHFYGFKFALGGIVSITAGDFEKTNGFPNLWAWGFEDNALNNRVLSKGLLIDRSQFYPLLDKNIIQIQDGVTRKINKTEFDVFQSDNGEGITSISQLNYEIDDSTGFVNVSQFYTDRELNPATSSFMNILKSNVPFPSRRRSSARMGMFR